MDGFIVSDNEDVDMGGQEDGDSAVHSSDGSPSPPVVARTFTGRSLAVAADGDDDDVQLFDDEASVESAPAPAACKDASKCCAVCWDKERSAAFIPCGHVVCCNGCAKKINTCPVCRATIQSCLTIFLA